LGISASVEGPTAVAIKSWERTGFLSPLNLGHKSDLTDFG
jgi:hypothetical protein